MADTHGRPVLWTCSKCSRRFANRNQSHSCGHHDLETHFAGKPAVIREIYRRFLDALLDIGPVTVLPERTRIAFQVRMSFAQLTPRRRWVDGHVVLAAPARSPVFRKVESISRRNHVHVFRLRTVDDVNRELRRWLRAAYAVGEQKHLSARTD